MTIEVGTIYAAKYRVSATSKKREPQSNGDVIPNRVGDPGVAARGSRSS